MKAKIECTCLHTKTTRDTERQYSYFINLLKLKLFIEIKNSTRMNLMFN